MTMFSTRKLPCVFGLADVHVHVTVCDGGSRRSVKDKTITDKSY